MRDSFKRPVRCVNKVDNLTLETGFFNLRNWGKDLCTEELVKTLDVVKRMLRNL